MMNLIVDALIIGRTPLHFSAFNGDVEAGRLLLQVVENIDIDAADHEGRR